MTSSLDWKRRARRATLLVGMTLAAMAARSQPPSGAASWVGTWAAAPQAAFPGPVDHYAGRTLRLIVHVSVGGERVRIRLSNTHGREPLRLADVHVARRGQGADIDPGSDRALRFDGRPDVVIAPGGTVTSDPVALGVPALSDLAISLYAPGRIDATTVHALAQQTSYVAAARGDVTATARFPKAVPLSAWPFLTGVEVDVPGGGAAIVAFGDSLIDGDGSTPDANARFGDALAARLQHAGGDCARVGVLDQGIIGNRLLHDSPLKHAPKVPDFGRALGESGLARFDRDVLQQAGVRAVLIHLGTNDIAFVDGVAPRGETAAPDDLVAAYRELVARAHRAGLKAIGSTLTPVEGVTLLPAYDTPAKEAARQRVNDWIRHAGAFDAVIDFDEAVRDPGQPARLDPRLASADHLHPDDAGYAAIAERLPLATCQAVLAP
jgi:lysophospholipase L1-like esterase